MLCADCARSRGAAEGSWCIIAGHERRTRQPPAAALCAAGGLGRVLGADGHRGGAGPCCARATPRCGNPCCGKAVPSSSPAPSPGGTGAAHPLRPRCWRGHGAGSLRTWCGCRWWRSAFVAVVYRVAPRGARAARAALPHEPWAVVFRYESLKITVFYRPVHCDPFRHPVRTRRCWKRSCAPSDRTRCWRTGPVAAADAADAAALPVQRAEHRVVADPHGVERADATLIRLADAAARHAPTSANCTKRRCRRIAAGARLRRMMQAALQRPGRHRLATSMTPRSTACCR